MATLVRPSSPFLYKYSSADRLDWLEGILLEHRLYFPNPRELKDPREARPILARASMDRLMAFLVQDFFRRHAATMPLPDLARHVKEIHALPARLGTDWLLMKLSATLNLELETHRIYSMTTRPNNEYLWMTYAKEHTGYCLEFQNNGLPFILGQLVVYVDAVTVDITEPDEISALFLFKKTLAYKQEEEVRIIPFPRGAPSLVSFEPSLLTRIILGKGMSSADRDCINKIALRRVPALVVSDE